MGVPALGVAVPPGTDAVGVGVGEAPPAGTVGVAVVAGVGTGEGATVSWGVVGDGAREPVGVPASLLSRHSFHLSDQNVPVGQFVGGGQVPVSVQVFGCLV